MKLGLRQNLQHRVSSAAVLGGGPSLTDQVIAFFGSGEEGGVWDFTDAANLATATDGTGVVSNGSAVAYCADLSGNGNHLLQISSSLNPAWDSSGFANFVLDALKVDWTATAQPVTRVTRCQLNSWANNDFLYAGGSASNRMLFIQSGSSPNMIMNVGSSSPGQAVSLSEMHTTVEFANGASSTLRLDGVTSSTFNVGTGNVGGISVGGNETGGFNLLDANIVRILMIDRELTSGELATAEAWAAEVL